MKTQGALRRSHRLFVSILALWVGVSCMLCGSRAAFAQQGKETGRPPAPAQVFNEYVTQPDLWRPAGPPDPGVDARGDLNITLPILTVPGRNGLNFDVHFHYRSSVRVKQQSSWIGLGWSFDPGSIIRDVQGIVVHQGGQDVAFNVDYTDSPSAQPDVYRVTLPETAFSMARHVESAGAASPPRGQPGDFYATDWRPWKIQPFSDGPVEVAGTPETLHTQRCLASGCEEVTDYHRFVLTDPNGTRFLFEQPTLSTYEGYDPLSPLNAFEFYVSTWRLTAILGSDYPGDSPPADLSAEGSWITFKYGEVHTAAGELDKVLGFRRQMQTTYLEEIVTPTHRAVFTVESREADVFPNPYPHTPLTYSKLTAIQLFVHFGTAENTLVEEVRLAQSQSLAAIENTRMALDEILFYGRDPSSPPLPGYKFEYYGTEGGTLIDQHDVDDFGYFNAGLTFSENQNDGHSWSLKSIVFPTGRKDIVFYENDEISLIFDGQNYTPYAVYYDYSDVLLGTTDTDLAYAFTEEKNRQGGARVSRLEHYQGSSKLATTSFSYGPGRASGVPPFFWERDLNENFFKPAGRGQVAVFYDYVTRTLDDGTFETTHYTTSATASGWVEPLQTTLCLYGARTVIQGNQDLVWGLPYQIQTASGEVSKTLDLTTYKLASSYDVPTVISLVWRYANKIDVEERLEYRGANVGAGGAYVSTQVDYKYDHGHEQATGLITRVEESGDGLAHPRVTEHRYGFQVPEYNGTDGLEERNLLTPVVQTWTAESTETALKYHRSQVTTWKMFDQDGYGVWHPLEVFHWKADEPDSDQPAFSFWQGGEPGSAWQRQVTYADYDPYGHVIEQRNARGTLLRFFYGDNGDPLAQTAGLNHALLTGMESGNLFSKLNYDERGRLTAGYNANDRKRSFVYDTYGRLAEIRDDAGSLVTDYSYYFSRTCTTSGGCQEEFEAGAPNYVRARRHTEEGVYETTIFLDAFGRTIQTQQTEGSAEIVSAIDYDGIGRVIKVWKPYRQSTSQSYDELYPDHALQYYDGDPGPNAFGFPFTEQEYDSRGLLTRRYPPSISTDRPYQQFDYQGEFLRDADNARLQDYIRVDVVTDEAGHSAIAYTDGLGRTFLTRRYLEVEPDPSVPDDITLSAARSTDSALPVDDTLVPDLVWEEESASFSVPAPQLVYYEIDLEKWGLSGTEVNFTEDGSFFKSITYDNALPVNQHTGFFTAYSGSTYEVTARAGSPIEGQGEGGAEVNVTLSFTRNGKITSLRDTRFEHDVSGNVLTSMPPNFFSAPYDGNPSDWQTTYRYNTLGQLVAKTTPDADGDFRYAYDAAGNIRFVEDPNHVNRSGSGFLYIRYDALDRIVENGIYTGNIPFGEAETAFADQDWPTQDTDQVFEHVYDSYAIDCERYAAHGFLDCPSVPAGANTDNPTGNLTQVVSENGYYFYFYDNENQVVDFYVFLDEALGGKRIAYDYDRHGNITKISYQTGQSDALIHWYTYDALGRLIMVKTNEIDDEASAVLETYYTYTPTGQAEEVQIGADLGSIPPINYAYNARGWLTQINDLEVPPGTEPFAMGLQYEQDGNIAVMDWATRDNLAPAARVRFLYAYDALGRLRSADFEKFADGWSSELIHDVGFDETGSPSPIEYDTNGNIISLTRHTLGALGQQVMDDLKYSYSGSNRLLSVSGLAGTSDPFVFSYDANGNATSGRTTVGVSYDWHNLPTSMNLEDSTSLEFGYDPGGLRILKRLSDDNGLIGVHFYVRGMDGSVLAVYRQDEESLHLEYWNILSGRTVIGRIAPPPAAN